MDIEHLRKQAKHLVRLYPELMASHPTSIRLGTAQAVIAQINGFPSWEAMLAKEAARPSTSNLLPATGIDLSRHLRFSILCDEIRLPVSYSTETGSPTRYRTGVEAILSYTSGHDERKALAEDERLNELFDQAFGPALDRAYIHLDAKTRLRLLTAVQKSLQACPYWPETYARLAGLWHVQGAHEQAAEVVGPIVDQLHALIPTGRYVQVPYGYLDNRPFHRLVHGYVLILDKLGRHADADRWAKQMVMFCPNDNIGFRYLTSRRKRAQSS